jgi:hypothetical protein
MITLPTFEDDFLNAVVESLRRRRKAISHKSAAIRVERIREVDGNCETEKLEINLKLYDKISVRLHAWQTRWIWLDVRKSSKRGWVWSWEQEGRPLPPLGGREIVDALETTHDLAFDMNAARTHEFTAIWAPMLARGPVSIR